MIENIISDYVSLKKHGRNYLGLCPFHEDNKPSLNVLPNKEIFKCFACGVGGNIIKFISKIENINLQEARKILYEKYKIQGFKPSFTPKFQPNQEQQKLIYEINNLATQFYQYQLTTENGLNALNYLKSRNISWYGINKFQLGYANDSNELLNCLLMNGFTNEQLLLAGVVRKNAKGQIIDVFKNRIIFPISDIKGNIVGFSGRSLENNYRIKYLNTGETFAFVKSNNLYNIANCLNSKNIYLVEGYMDVVAASELGLNAVAIMGTSLAKEQEKLLVDNFQNIKLFLDNDIPGIEASKIIAQNLFKYSNLKLTVINNPTKYKDLSELVTKYSKDEILGALNEINNTKKLNNQLANIIATNERRI